jgi:hypothetical protein
LSSGHTNRKNKQQTNACTKTNTMHVNTKEYVSTSVCDKV